MSDLTEFLLARIAEDEEVAKLATNSNAMDLEFIRLGLPRSEWPEWYAASAKWHTEVRGRSMHVRRAAQNMRAADAGREECAHIARHDPARVLADCAAKRRIVERLEPITEADDGCVCDRCMTLRDLAAAYVDHPDYREEWRP